MPPIPKITKSLARTTTGRVEVEVANDVCSIDSFDFSFPRHNHVPDVNVPSPVDNDETVNSSSTYGAKLNFTSIIALSSFGGFVFLAALITTIVILVRR